MERTQIILTIILLVIELVAFGSIVMLVIYLFLAHDGNLVKIVPSLTIYAIASIKLLPAFQQIYSSVADIRANIPAFESIHQDLFDSSTTSHENLKDLKAILDVAKMLSDKSSYFKGRGSKKEYIKMLVHKIRNLSESKKQKLMTRMDAYKKVRKPTLPKSRPMQSKKKYNRADFKKGKYD